MNIHFGPSNLNLAIFKYLDVVNEFSASYIIGLIYFSQVKKTQADQSILHFFFLFVKNKVLNIQMSQLQKHFSSVCISLVQLALVNAIYSI